MWRAVIARAGMMADDGTAAAGAYFRQEGIFFYLDAPTLVLGEMPMKVIHLVQIKVKGFEPNALNMLELRRVRL